MAPPHPLPLHERLTLLVRHALPGTLIPVDSLRELLEEHQRSAAVAPGYSLEEVASRCAALGAGGKPVQPSAVRKWIRDGLRGVRLTAFSWGNTYRVREDALNEFILAIQNAPRRNGRAPAVPPDAASIREEIASSRQKYARGSRAERI